MYPEWFLTKNRPKNRRENRGERRERSFGRFHSGELRRIYPGAVDLSGERKELHDFRRRHFSRVSMGMRENVPGHSDFQWACLEHQNTRLNRLLVVMDVVSHSVGAFWALTWSWVGLAAVVVALLVEETPRGPCTILQWWIHPNYFGSL